MSLENLLVIVAVVVAAVFNVIMPWLKRLQENALAGNVEPELQKAPATALAAGLPASPAPGLATRRHTPTSATAGMAPATARPARRLPVGSRSRLRDGIVFAAVLGPCRAQTPFV